MKNQTLSLLAAALFTTAAYADTPAPFPDDDYYSDGAAVWLSYQGVKPGVSATLWMDKDWAGAGTMAKLGTFGVGTMQFRVDDNASHTNTEDIYSMFCSEVTQTVAAKNVWVQYTVKDPIAGAVPTDSSLQKINGVRQAQLERLYGLVFFDGTDFVYGSTVSSWASSATDSYKLAAFQLALWELVNDDSDFDIGTGYFKATGIANGSVVTQANSWLADVEATFSTKGVAAMNLIGLANSSRQDQLFPTSGYQVPEPSTYALIAGLLSLAVVFWRRQSRRS